MKKRQAIFRIVITYLLVLLPLLVVSFFVTQTLLRSVEQEELAKIDKQLNFVAQAIDDDFVSYTDKGVSLMQLKPFSTGQLFGKPIVQLDAIEMLQKLRLFDGRVNEILVFYGEEYLCGNNGISSPTVYFQTTLKCTQESTKDAWLLLSSDQPGAAALETTVGSPYLMYHIPVGQDTDGRHRSVQYIFPISDMERLLDSILETNGVLLQLTIGKAELHFYNSELGCDFQTADKAQALLSDMSGDSLAAVCTGQNATIRVWYNDSEQMQRYHEIRNVCILILMVGILLSTVLSVCISFRRMRDIRQLASNIIGKRVSKSSDKTWGKSEFDYIQALVDESIKDGNLVRKNVNNYRHIILQQVAMMIFHGILRDRAEIQSLLSICGTELVEEYFYLCGIHLEDAEDTKLLEPYVQEDLHYLGDDRFVIMLCQYHSYDYDMRHRKDVAERLLSTLRSIGISCDRIVMSQVYNHISMANYAYLEINSILEHMDTGSDAVVCWEDMITQQDRHNYRFDNEHLQMFYAAVEQKNGKQAEKMLERIFAQNGQQRDEEYARYMRYMVAQALRLGARSVFAEENAPLQQLNAIELEDGEDFIAEVKRLLKDYCRADGVYDKILQYVNDNFTRYDLSLEQLAEEANVSKAQMSKIFRAKTGACYIDYVTNLRMEKARELLATTSLGVKEIFRQVGYIDSTNASKKFKAIYNITPSVYRSAIQKAGTPIQEELNDV